MPARLPIQSKTPFHIDPRPLDEMASPHAGLLAASRAARSLHLPGLVSANLQLKSRKRGFTEGQFVESILLLQIGGGDCPEDVSIFHDDLCLERGLGYALPKATAVREFLGRFHDESIASSRPARETQKSFILPSSSGVAGLQNVQAGLVRQVAKRYDLAGERLKIATLDMDATIIESHKESALPHYEGGRGYQPMVAVWAEADLVVADEFRDGNVPGGKDPLSSVRRAFEALPSRVTVRRFRGDSADYHLSLLRYLVEENIGFTISADMTRELRAVCVDLKKSAWRLLETRERESVHLAEVEFTPGDWPKDARPLRYVAVRFTPKQDDFFEEPKYLAVVSNRDELSMAELVGWHWGKAGTIEHVHRVMKDELGASVMPSGRFGANAAWFRINALAFNLLAVLRRRALPPHLEDARPKRLRFEVFTLPGRLALHQRQVVVQVSAAGARGQALDDARGRLAQLWETRWGDAP